MIFLLLYTFLILHVVFTVVQGARQLRLNHNSGITHYSSGRLEIYYYNEWIPFTMDGFNMQAADLACKSLGYKYASRCARVGTLGLVLFVCLFVFISTTLLETVLL